MDDAKIDSVHALQSAVAKVYPDHDLTPIATSFELLQAHAQAHSADPDATFRDALETTAVLADMRLDPPAICAAVIARLGLSSEQIVEQFGEEVGGLVDGVSRLQQIRWNQLEQEAAETLRKMFMAMAADIRVVLIALAGRVQQMRGIRDAQDQPTVDEEQRQSLAQDTLDVFAPLANRLGIWQLKWELEDLALRELEPEVFDDLSERLQAKRDERNAFIREFIESLKNKLAEEGIEAAVSGRAKHVYSIYKKMQRKQVSFDQIYDVTAVRIITKRMADCYAALGMIHSLWVPLPGEFDDYIAKPKDNLYQSLHTAVIGPGGRPLEVQIRTDEMHQYAEYGVAAHWAYKEKLKGPRAIDKKFMVLRQLMDWERDVADPHQFVESLKTDVFEDQVYVFTPAGDILDLPVGSTPLDFAYRIHTQVGHRCKGAKVNDQIVPLDYQLKTGERVEILTHKHPSPSRDWLNPNFGYLRTANARAKARQWFRAQSRDTSIAQGREIVGKEIERLDLQHTGMEEVAVALKYPTMDDLYAAVGFGDRSSQSVASAAMAIEREKCPPEDPPVPPSVPVPSRKRTASGLSLDGIDDILGKRARCCNPVPGDPVVGFVSRGRGITIHRRDCPHVAKQNEPERVVDIEWGPGAGERHPVDVMIRAHDRPGLLRDLSALITQSGVNMRAARAEARDRDGNARIELSLEFSSAEQVVQVLQKIDKFPDVVQVRRLGR